jgi:ketosteroid isomerase-like protein
VPHRTVVNDDIEAIKQLKARYFRLMDTKDWDGLARVFTDDVTIDVTAEGGGVTNTLDQYLPTLQTLIGDVITVHHGHTPEIELTSTTTATGIWALEDQLWWPDGTHMHGFGHYHETYSKAGGEWRIQSMTITRLHRIFS